MIRSAFFLCAMLLCSFVVHASFEQREFKTPQDKALFDDLVAELRCLVCQNQNIADSNADLAVDLRKEIFSMINAGQSKSDILGFMVQRYGEFVLYKPRLSAQTLVLWFGPACLFLFGLIVLWCSAKNRKPVSADNTPDQAALLRARRLLDNDTQE